MKKQTAENQLEILINKIKAQNKNPILLTSELADAILADTELVKAIVRERVEVDRTELSYILCEYTPSVAKDSGVPEWCKGELDKVTGAIAEKRDKVLRG